jgi:hypothetical protein
MSTEVACYMKKESLMQKQKKKQHNIKRRHHKHQRTKQSVIEKQNIGNIFEEETMKGKFREGFCSSFNEA